MIIKKVKAVEQWRDSWTLKAVRLSDTYEALKPQNNF